MKHFKVPIQLYLILFCFSTLNCSKGRTADVIILSNTIQTVDEDMTVVQGLAIKDGIIIATGSKEEILQYQSSETKIIEKEKCVCYAWVYRRTWTL